MPKLSTGDSGELALRGCRLVHTTSRGRCVVAARPLKSGELLLRERAVCGVDSSCLRGVSDMFPALDRPEWLLVQLLRDRQHRTETDEPSPPLLLGVLTLRLIRASRVTPAAAVALRSICPLAAPLSPALAALSSVVLSVLLRLEPSQQKHRDVLAEECRRVVGSLSCNLFTVTDTELLPRGVALFPAAALFNHSCAPAACQVFPRAGTAEAPEERVVEVRAIRAVQPGEELCVSYIDSAQPRQERQCALLQTYRFRCTCSKCCVADPRDAWRCCSPRCPGLYGPTPALERIRYHAWLLRSAPQNTTTSHTTATTAVASKVPVAARTVLMQHSATSVGPIGCLFPCLVPSSLLQPTAAEALVCRGAADPAWPDSQLAWLFSNFCSSRSSDHRGATLDASWRGLAGGSALQCEVCSDTQSLLWVVQARRDLLAAVPTSSSAVVAVDQWLRSFRLLQQRVPRTHYLTFDWGTKLCLALIHSQRFEEALSVSASVLDTLPCLYPGAHPVALVQRYQACKLLRLLGWAALPQAVPGTAKYQAEDLLGSAVVAARTLFGDTAGCTENVAAQVTRMTL